ncbi:MAG: hypothetical protein Q9186_001159 [Xanthomendoza sp. 1 TL-2023]
MNRTDLLILGAGWTSTYIIPLLNHHGISYEATTRDGRCVHSRPTISFTFDPLSDDLAPYRRLPTADTVLVVFPLRGKGQSRKLVEMYDDAHNREEMASEVLDAATERSIACSTKWIQLGSTGVWKGEGFLDRLSPVDLDNPRAVAEEELLAVVGKRACILHLAGLWGGERQPRNWISRVAKSKEEVKGKGALHLVHGDDVARAVVGCLENWENLGGQRWIVNDLRTWDWWDLILGWASYRGEGKKGEGGDGGMERYGQWVVELMEQEGVRALPRGREVLGRCLDGRGFWKAVAMVPVKSLLG